MNLSDTIKILNDSTSNLVGDSLSPLDTLAKIDSIRIADSIQRFLSIPKAPTGYVGIPHPVFPNTEYWIFVVFLFLFLVITFSISRSHGELIKSLKTIVNTKERTSIFNNTTVIDLRFRFLNIFFTVGVISLYVYIVIQPYPKYSLQEYAFLCVITSVFLLLKSFIIDLTGYVFFDKSKVKLAKESYFKILSFFGILLFIILNVRIYSIGQYVSIVDYIALILGGFALVLIILKLFQIFLYKTIASFYILLYLCTLEILPLFLLFRVYKLII